MELPSESTTDFCQPGEKIVTWMDLVINYLVAKNSVQAQVKMNLFILVHTILLLVLKKIKMVHFVDKSRTSYLRIWIGRLYTFL